MGGGISPAITGTEYKDPLKVVKRYGKEDYLYRKLQESESGILW